jgi:hypothetical protein
VVTVPSSGESRVESYLLRAGLAGIALLAGLLLASA